MTVCVCVFCPLSLCVCVGMAIPEISRALADASLARDIALEQCTELMEVPIPQPTPCVLLPLPCPNLFFF